MASTPSPARSLVLADLRHEQAGRDAQASMHLERDGEDLGRLVMRRHGASPEEIDTSGTPFVALAAMLAGAQGCDLRIDAPVDDLAAHNAEAAGILLGGWFGWHVPLIATARPAGRSVRASAAGLFFSRGLDSMTTLVTERARITMLIGMDWRDAPFAGDGTAGIWRGTQRAAAEACLPLAGVSTNARSFLDPVVPWDISHGVVLGALAQLVTPAIGEAIVSGTHLPGREQPHGSHPSLVGLWTSSRLVVSYAAGPGSRNEKAAAVADDPFAMRWLKVCWERAGDGNCGRCTKCLETMTNFAIAGRLEAVSALFDAPLTPEAVRATARSAATTPANLLSILAALGPADPLYEPWQRVYARAIELDPTTAAVQHG